MSDIGPHQSAVRGRRMRIGAVTVLSVVLIAASCEPIEDDPDAEPFTAVLEDCVVEKTGANSGVETCTVSSEDPRVDGSWEFNFVEQREEDRSIYQGDVSITTSSGGWEGTSFERVMTDSGSFKGGGAMDGVGSNQGLIMHFGDEGESFDGTYPLTGNIAPDN